MPTNPIAPPRPWVVCEVTPWPRVVGEGEGLRTKYWLEDPESRRWLRKHRREARAYEPAIEVIALELAARAGLLAPEGRVCEWHAEASEGPCTKEKLARGGGHQAVPCQRRSTGISCRGVVVRNFLKEGEELRSGMPILLGSDARYNPSRREAHTLDAIRTALRREESKHPSSRLVEAFAHMLTFDAWIGNGDRHQSNWGLITKAGNPTRLAPLYDPASSLGAELQTTEVHRLSKSTAELIGYLGRCGSGFGNGMTRHLLTQSDVLEQVSHWPEWAENVHSWVVAFCDALDTPFVHYLEAVPDEWLPPLQKDLVFKLLVERFAWLKQTYLRRMM